MKPIFILFATICIAVQAFAVHTDSTTAVFAQLKIAREKVIKNADLKPEERVSRMLDLGMWKQADVLFRQSGNMNKAMELQYARYQFLNKNYLVADSLVRRLLKGPFASKEPLFLKAKLKVQAWKLDEATKLCNDILVEDAENADAAYLKGKIMMLQKKREEADQWAKHLQKVFPKHYGGYLLEGNCLLWKQKPSAAEISVKRALQLNPFNADAQFLYGYLIWRRVDASQLKDMAAHWELALQINPLHYLTHWHWGNGHTHLTYADYAQEEDEKVREELETAERFFASGKISDAIDFTRKILKQYPKSVLPLLYRASYYYSDFDSKPRPRLDSAASIFKQILRKKPHFGPAHNGLATVIRAKGIPYIYNYDSVGTALGSVNVSQESIFTTIFPDAAYYPGNTVKSMISSQLHTAKAYLPMLEKLQRTFAIPPLHKDLALAMHNPYFRGATTFDNRQWMDIRGVGSGAAGIEYVEKAAFGDRNVLLHEFVHLLHGTVFTDKQVREIRQLFYNAKRKGATLDYYAANNEHEYFAQVYPAFFSKYKVHPLDYKSTNTRQDLKKKDPDAFAFMQNLVTKEKAFLDGDTKALAANLAQTNVLLSQKARDENYVFAATYLDSALRLVENYLPAVIAFSYLEMRQKHLGKAEEWLQKAQKTDADYAPVYLAYGRLAALGPESDSLKRIKIEGFYQKAYDLEDDLQEKARIARLLYVFYKNYSDLPQAINTAEQLVSETEPLSTYLKDDIEDAKAFAAHLKGLAGYSEAIKVLAGLLQMNPQNYHYRELYADVLAMNKQYRKAINVLAEAQKILRVAGNPRRDFTLKMIKYHQTLFNTDTVGILLKEIADWQPESPFEALELVRVYSFMNNYPKANTLFRKIEVPELPYPKAHYEFTQAKLLEADGEMTEATAHYRKAIALNPYHFLAYAGLLKYYRTKGEVQNVDGLMEKIKALALQPGPGIEL